MLWNTCKLHVFYSETAINFTSIWCMGKQSSKQDFFSLGFKHPWSCSMLWLLDSTNITLTLHCQDSSPGPISTHFVKLGSYQTCNLRNLVWFNVFYLILVGWLYTCRIFFGRLRWIGIVESYSYQIGQGYAKEGADQVEIDGVLELEPGLIRWGIVERM